MYISENDLKYDTVMRERDGKVHLFVREIGLVGTGDTVEAAYEELKLQRQAFVKEINETGFIDQLPAPISGKGKSTAAAVAADPVVQGLRPLAIRTAVATLVVAIILAPVGWRAKKYLDVIRDHYVRSLADYEKIVDSVGKVAHFSASMGAASDEIVKRLELKSPTDVIRETASELKAMTRDDHVDLLKDMQTISATLRPYVHELQYMTGDQRKHFHIDDLPKDKTEAEAGANKGTTKKSSTK